MSEIVSGDFNYGSLDPETAVKLVNFATSGKALIRKNQIQFIADFGKVLSEARGVLANNKNGTFIKWATAEFDISKDTVYRYLNAWDRILSHGATIYLNWSPTAVYLASSDEISTPVQKKLEKLSTTDLVRASDVKRLMDASKPTPGTATGSDSKPASRTAQGPDQSPHGSPASNSDDVPFDAAPTLTPAEAKAAEKAAKEKARAEEKAAAAAEKEAAKQAKEAEKAAAKAEREKVKAEKAAEKAAKEKAKADAKAAKEAARLEALTTEGQIKNVKHLINQHIGQMVRLIADLNRLKPNRAAMNANIKVLEGVKLW